MLCYNEIVHYEISHKFYQMQTNAIQEMGKSISLFFSRQDNERKRLNPRPSPNPRKKRIRTREESEDSDIY